MREKPDYKEAARQFEIPSDKPEDTSRGANKSHAYLQPLLWFKQKQEHKTFPTPPPIPTSPRTILGDDLFFQSAANVLIFLPVKRR